MASVARFGVSPGLEGTLARRVLMRDMALIPGVATPSEVMLALGYGFSTLKVFPAASLGGVSYVRSLSAVFPKVRWFPTGGVTPESAASWRAVITGRSGTKYGLAIQIRSLALLIA